MLKDIVKAITIPVIDSSFLPRVKYNEIVVSKTGNHEVRIAGIISEFTANKVAAILRARLSMEVKMEALYIGEVLLVDTKDSAEEDLDLLAESGYVVIVKYVYDYIKRDKAITEILNTLETCTLSDLKVVTNNADSRYPLSIFIPYDLIRYVYKYIKFIDVAVRALNSKCLLVRDKNTRDNVLYDVSIHSNLEIDTMLNSFIKGEYK